MDKRPHIDALLQHHLLQTADQELAGVEAGVWAKIHREYFHASARQLHRSTLALSVSLALIAGAWFATPVFSTGTPELSAFSSRPYLAPSTLLEGI
ncbi:MAG: hypothetical protein AB7O49_04365 [Sphingomonadales bacterium]